MASMLRPVSYTHLDVYKRQEELSEALPHAMIIQGEAIDKELLLEEEIRETDAFAAMTDIDEENIMLSLYAKKVSHAKTMTKIDKKMCIRDSPWRPC